MAGRPPGTKNKKHTNRQGQLTLSVDDNILAQWRDFCDWAGITMSSRFEQLMKQDINTDNAFGLEPGQTVRINHPRIGETQTYRVVSAAELVADEAARQEWESEQ